MTRHTVVESPLGPLVLVERDGGVAALGPLEHAPSWSGERDDTVLPGLAEQLDAYFAGSLQRFDVPLAATGTPWQQQVWAALREVPYGQTWTYGQLAAHLGRPTASRAVGSANSRNPVSIVVPCHRVVGSSGTLTGYAGGLERKRYLLEHERRHATPGGDGQEQLFAL